MDEADRPTTFGKWLAKDVRLGGTETDTSLRTTIDKLAVILNTAGTRLVACNQA